MTDHNPSARMQLRDRSQLQHPANCSVCGTASARTGYADPAIWFEYEGNVYFCQTCTEELAQLFGCLTTKESDFLRTVNENLANDNASLKEKLNYAEQRLTAYDTILAGIPALSSPVLPIVSSDSGSEVNNDSVADTTDRGAESESESPESVTERRPNDAPRITVSNSGINL